MPTKFKKLDKENWDSLHRMALGIYLEGQCYEFAVALHRGLGWPLVGLMKDHVIRHVLVRSPQGELRDVRGIVKNEEVGMPFQIYGDCIFRDVTEDDLRKQRPVNDPCIERASLFAETLWPELPWNKNCLRSKALSFMQELEELCKKHGVWIRAPYPAASIVLGKMYGDEGGFKMSPTLDGQYFFDRYLE